MKRFHQLNAQEKAILHQKKTEVPFTGRFNDHFERGIYLCRQCDAPLYLSSDKFSSHCGWPSFDDEITEAIERKLDADERRIEILCSHCGGHLGHFFENEGLTPKNVRHCVNSLSMSFIGEKTAEGYERAFFAGGCFWGLDYYFGQVSGVVDAIAGYMGGDVVNPSYEEVCLGNTGHAETVEVIFNPAIIKYHDLVDFFFSHHNPSQLNRQGPDVGTQYRSVIFYLSALQKAIAEDKKRDLELEGKLVVTEIRPASRFYQAEEYHQNYYLRSGRSPSCPI